MALLQRAFLCVSLRMVWRENGASPKSILYKTEVGKGEEKYAALTAMNYSRPQIDFYGHCILQLKFWYYQWNYRAVYLFNYLFYTEEGLWPTAVREVCRSSAGRRWGTTGSHIAVTQSFLSVGIILETKQNLKTFNSYCECYFSSQEGRDHPAGERVKSAPGEPGCSLIQPKILMIFTETIKLMCVIKLNCILTYQLYWIWNHGFYGDSLSGKETVLCVISKAVWGNGSGRSCDP